MIYTLLTYKAMNLAYNAHHGQTDKSGAPYIFHPIHLAEQMEDEFTCCAALLHDVVEDTDVTLEDLAKDFPAEVVEAVRLLTHLDGVPDEEYILAIRENPIARTVKLADIAHNGNQRRCAHANIPQEKLDRWKVKYAKARAILMGE